MKDGHCEEKSRLLLEFRSATKLYSIRVGVMSEAAAGFIPTAEFTRLSEVASQAHEKCLQAFERFRKHQAEHGC